MDRIICYPGAIPLDTDVLNAQRNTMLGLGGLAGAMLGINTQTVVSGLACTPTAPTSMTVNVGPGSILQYMIVDGSSFGSLPADTADSIQKMGINLASTPFTLTAPTTSGQSINYLIQASLQESDNTPVTLPYYNSSNPAQPFSGPNNSGTPQNTARTQRVQLQLKAGAPANTGTQVTPTVDNGWVGLSVISVNFGQTSVTAGNIVSAANSPVLAGLLNSHHGGVPGQAPKIHLDSEVQGVLPLANLPSLPASSLPQIRFAHGECRLNVVSATQIQLVPRNGNNLMINGQQFQLPVNTVAGNTATFVNGASGQSLAASTTYFVYAFSNGGTVALDFSTTGHATDSSVANAGVEIKSGDSTRSLVGMLRTNASSQFVPQSGALNQLCLSWFNRRVLALQGASVVSSTTSLSFVAVGTISSFNLLTWADESVVLSLGGTVSNDTTGDGAKTSVMFDGVPIGSQGGGTVATGSQTLCANGQVAIATTEGFHTASPALQCVTGGTASCAIAIQGFVRG